MTDLQVKYQTLQETKRHNAVQEMQNQLDVESNAQLRAANVSKTSAEIKKILADASLSQAQKLKAINDAQRQQLETAIIRSDPYGFVRAVPNLVGGATKGIATALIAG